MNKGAQALFSFQSPRLKLVTHEEYKTLKTKGTFWSRQQEEGHSSLGCILGGNFGRAASGQVMDSPVSCQAQQVT